MFVSLSQLFFRKKITLSFSTRSSMLLFILSMLFTSAFADSWTTKANFGGTRREQASGFAIGNKGYFGCGIDSLADRDDFWEYDQTGNTWSQKANFPGTPRGGGISFAINGKGYIGTGYDGTVFTADMHEYNPGNNTWTQKADFPGSGGRQGAVAFVIANKAYVGTGYSTTNGNNVDFWQYDPVGDSWVQKANYGGTARNSCAGFSVGTKGYICCGYNGIYNKDVWEYDSQNDTWAQKADLGGSGRTTSLGFTIAGIGYVAIGFDITTGYKQDLWQYDQGNDSWTSKATYPGKGDGHAACFVIGKRAYVGTGHENTYFKDFYEYAPDSISTSLDVPTRSISINVFPNPCKGRLYIEYKATGDSAQFTLYDISGKEINSVELSPLSISAEVELGEFPNGVYFYSFICGKDLVTGKIVLVQ